jgi:hypothetical protein
MQKPQNIPFGRALALLTWSSFSDNFEVVFRKRLANKIRYIYYLLQKENAKVTRTT